MKYKFLLFDLDGTIFDYDKAEMNALKKTFNDFGFGFEETHLELYRKFNAQVWREFEEGTLQQDELKIRRFDELKNSLKLDFNIYDFSDSYLKNLSGRTDLIDGSAEILDILQSNYKIFLITNGLKDVQRPRIAASEVAKYFKDIIISEEVGYAKPDPKIFDIAFKRMNNPGKDEVLLIGDSLSSDITGGSNYGVDTCWFNPKSIEKPHGLNITHEIKNLDELINILQ